MENQKGSEWRKWDLHIHTPETKLNDHYKDKDGKNKWDLFCDQIEKSDVSVFGITDYFSIENYNKHLKKFKQKYPHSKKIFFPNIEFRLDSKNSAENHIQIHVLFSNASEIIEKTNNFFTRLQLVSTDDKTLKNKYCTSDDLLEIGYGKAMVTIDDLEKALKNDFPDNKYIIIGVANGYGALTAEGVNMQKS
jgi:hypothetical protein